MTIAELKVILEQYEDDVEVVISVGGERFYTIGTYFDEVRPRIFGLFLDSGSELRPL